MFKLNQQMMQELLRKKIQHYICNSNKQKWNTYNANRRVLNGCTRRRFTTNAQENYYEYFGTTTGGGGGGGGGGGNILKLLIISSVVYIGKKNYYSNPLLKKVEQKRL